MKWKNLKMIKTLVTSLLITILITFNSFSAGSSDSGSSKTRTQYDMAVSYINDAKKFEKKNKLKKAKKNMRKLKSCCLNLIKNFQIKQTL